MFEDHDERTLSERLDDIEREVRSTHSDVLFTASKVRQVEFAAAIAAVASVGCFVKLMGWL